MMGKIFLHNVKSFHIIFIYTYLFLLLLPVYVSYTCPKQVNRFRTFPVLGSFVYNINAPSYVDGYHKLCPLGNRCIFIFAVAIFVFRFFGCFVYFSGFSFLCLLRLSMKNKKYKQREEIYDLMQSRYTRFLLRFPLSCNCA